MPETHSLSDYALWLVPAGAEHERLQQIIRVLASFETSSPVFGPHITLIHPIPGDTPPSEIQRTLTRIIEEVGSNSLHDFAVDLLPAQSGTHYYQSVLAPVKPTPLLLALRQSCQDAFKVQIDKPYFPHLSLFYGDVTKDRRDELAGKVDAGDLGRIQIREIAIVKCEGTADDWVVAGRVPL